jgi:transposase
METRHERPDYVRDYRKPKGTEVKHINGSWYLYERKTRYDAASKRSRKVSGRMLGKITEKGFVPRETKITDAFEVEVREFGAFQYFYDNSRTMREKLMEFFPGSWERIYTTAILRATYGPRFKRVAQNYEDSIAGLVYPGLPLSPSAFTPFLRELGRNREGIRLFMSAMRGEGGRLILVDGHRILSSSQTVDNAEVGYDSKMRYRPQVNLVYLFSLGEDCAFPEYYKQYAGSVTDVSAFADLLSEAGLAEGDATIVGDKGFMSEGNCSLIEESSLSYIIPLRRGNVLVGGRVPAEPLGYERSFTYNGRSVFCSTFEHDGFNVHLFRDSVLYQSELDDLLARTEKRNAATESKAKKERDRRKANKGRLSDEQLASLVSVDNALLAKDCSEMGTMSIKTNRTDLNAQQVYAIYKQRQSIEQYFKTYGDTMRYDDSCLRHNESLEAWLFLNHLSLMLTMDAIDDIYSCGKDKDYSFEDLRSLLVKIRASKFADDWHPCKKTQKVISFCSDLSLNIEKIEVPYK